MPTADTPTEHLHEQVEFLRTHAANFDTGKDHFAKPLAGVLRTLLHQTRRSTALLVAMSMRDSMRWLDSAGEVDEQHTFARISIASLSVSTTVGSGEVEARYFAPLNVNARSLPPAGAQVADILKRGRKPWRPGDWLPFLDWWRGEAVAIDADGVRFSREDLVLAMAHKEGGAHIDDDMDAAYRKLTRANGLGYSYGLLDGLGQPGELFPEPDPVPAAIRQIAYEVDVSLVRQFPELQQQ